MSPFDEECPAAWRRGVHEIYCDGSTFYCRACGAGRDGSAKAVSVEPERDALWYAIYAAEFVNRLPIWRSSEDEPHATRMAAREAKELADQHYKIVPKEER